MKIILLLNSVAITAAYVGPRIGPPKLQIFLTADSQLYTVDNSYDPEVISRYYDKHPLIVWERLTDIGSPIIGWWISRKFDNFTAPFRSKEDNQRTLNLRAADLKDSIVQGKSVTFIKSGQALALRPDIVKSPEYVRELQKLQDEVGTFDNDVAMGIIAQEIGVDPQEIFQFDPILPIASASIGQVYRARLKSNNKEVAIKVQRPDAATTAALDLYILRKLAAIAKKRYKLRTNLVGIVDEFGSQLYNELNYRKEANNCLRFRELYGQIPGIYVPGVDLDLTTQRVLTMEWVDGVKGPWPVRGEKMLTVGLQCSVLQLLDTGFFHADPHRGNLLQTPDGRLAYLDFGMMAEVPADKRYGLIGTVLGLVNKDINMVIRNLRDLDFFPPDTDTGVVVDALNSAILNSTENGQGSSLNFTRLSQNLEMISYLLPVRLPPFYTLIIRTLTILEGLALYVDPKFRLIRGAYPFIAKQILTSPSPALGELLRAVIVNKDGRIRWSKLEQFISISSNADAAVAGDFGALQRAQSRSDVQKIYGGVEQSSNMTLEVSGQILDFLLSDNGRVLREPLVLELVDTIDALGLTVQSLGYIASNGLIPRPTVTPDRVRVEQFLKLMQLVIDRARSSAVDDLPRGEAGGALGLIGGIINKLIATLEGVVSQETAGNLQPLLVKLTPIANEVIGLLIERNVRRGVKSVFSSSNVERTLPALGRILELVTSASKFLPTASG